MLDTIRINTTTIPTINADALNEMDASYSYFLRLFLIVLFSTFAGLTSGFCFVGQYIYPMYCKRTAASALLENMTSDEDSENEEEKDEKDEKEKYMKSYCAAFQALDATRILSNDELSLLKTKTVNEIIQEQLDDGETLDKEIVMTYNCDTDSFWYYTNYSTRISFEMLNMVARKFAIEYNCRSVYKGDVFTEELSVEDTELSVEEEEDTELSEQEELSYSDEEEVAEEEVAAEEAPIQTKSIFARFKNYNTDPLPIKNDSSLKKDSVLLPVVNDLPKNQFKYKGKLFDYAASIKRSDDADSPTLLKTSKIDYAAFKKQYILNKI